jgi:hypothetical protein
MVWAWALVYKTHRPPWATAAAATRATVTMVAVKWGTAVVATAKAATATATTAGDLPLLGRMACVTACMDLLRWSTILCTMAVAILLNITMTRNRPNKWQTFAFLTLDVVDLIKHKNDIKRAARRKTVPEEHTNSLFHPREIQITKNNSCGPTRIIHWSIGFLAHQRKFPNQTKPKKSEDYIV